MPAEGFQRKRKFNQSEITHLKLNCLKIKKESHLKNKQTKTNKTIFFCLERYRTHRVDSGVYFFSFSACLWQRDSLNFTPHWVLPLKKHIFLIVNTVWCSGGVQWWLQKQLHCVARTISQLTPTKAQEGFHWPQGQEESLSHNSSALLSAHAGCQNCAAVILLQHDAV